MPKIDVAAALQIRVIFPRRAYSGSDFGTPEALPSPARIHAAFVSAAAGGPTALRQGRLLVADDSSQQAVRWLEDNEPVGVIAPATAMTKYQVRRYRLRAAPAHPNETPFEPLCALGGPIVYAWPEPSRLVVEKLKELAVEVSHIGRVEGDAIVTVEVANLDSDHPGFLALSPGRGPGRELRVPVPGRFGVLVEAYEASSKPGRHVTGKRSKQAADEQPTGAEDNGTVLRRFSAPRDLAGWPFDEVWKIPIPEMPARMLADARRVGVAVAVHRGLVAAIASDVPAFVSGRDGGGPLTGHGHLAIHITRLGSQDLPHVVLAPPAGVSEADRAELLSTLDRRPAFRFGSKTLRLGPPSLASARSFWPQEPEVLSTEIPMVLDAPGPPRRGRWTLDDAVLCSVGYALRRLLEDRVLEWGTGWSFRQRLVATLRERGVDVRARRVLSEASPFVHRARSGDLLVAVDATVELGDLAAGGGGFLALGRARHLGGGLLRPPKAPAL